MHRKDLLATAVACVLAAPAAQATDWLQFGYDTAHSSFNRAEKGYPTASGNGAALRYALPAGTERIDGAPVYLGNVVTPGGTKNLLFGMSNNGTIIAVDADAQTPGSAVVWSHKPTGTSKANQRGFGAPVIDPSLQYVYAYAFDGTVRKYQVGDGIEITGGGWPAVVTLKPNIEKGASGLSIGAAHNGSSYLYSVTDGFIGDAGDYQGHLTAIDLATGSAKVFNSLCSDLTFHFVENGVKSGGNRTDCATAQSGIWGRPGAIYDEGTDLVFITTGNGTFNVNPGMGLYHWGDSVLALHPDGSGSGVTGMPVDSYTPATAQTLDDADADLGSESLALLPAVPGAGASYQHLGVQTGKDGCVRLLRLDNLSGQGGPAHSGGEIQAIDFRGATNHCATGIDGPELRAQPAVWVNPADGAVWVYVASHSGGSGAGFAAYRVGVTAGVPALTQQWDNTNGDPTSPVVANGVVYYLSAGKLKAYNAVSGAAVVTGGAWTTTTINGPHWQSPVLVDGRFYVFDEANPSNLWVYQLDGAFKNGFE
jgi:hypothetical protein